MKNTTRHVRWTVLLLLGLVLTLAVAGSVLGGMPKDAVPLAAAQDTPRYVLQEDVTIEAPTATHTPDPYAPPPSAATATATSTLDPAFTLTPTPVDSSTVVVINTEGLPGSMGITSSSTQVGQIFEVIFDSTSFRGARASIRFDPDLLMAVNTQGNPVDRVDSAWYDLGHVSVNKVNNAAGTIELDISRNPGHSQPLAVLRFVALADGIASLDIIAGEQIAICAPVPWGQFVVIDGLIQIAPAPTATPTLTATPTATPLSRMVYGSTLDDSASAVPGAQLTLYRDAGSWVTQASGASGSDGVFRLYTNPIPGDYRLEMTPPEGYSAVSAQLPTGLSGTVLGPDELAFSLGSEAGQIGSFDFTMELVVSSSTSVEGVIWLDANGDNARQPEEGLSGCELTLSAGELSTQLTKITDAAGHYAFEVNPGTYTLALHDPQNRVPGQQREIDTEALDPGPIDWGNYTRWLPMLSKVKGF